MRAFLHRHMREDRCQKSRGERTVWKRKVKRRCFDTSRLSIQADISTFYAKMMKMKVRSTFCDFLLAPLNHARVSVKTCIKFYRKGQKIASNPATPASYVQKMRIRHDHLFIFENLRDQFSCPPEPLGTPPRCLRKQVLWILQAGLLLHPFAEIRKNCLS